MSLNDQGFNQSILNLKLMKKSVLKLGKSLEKKEQQLINGGYIFTCERFCSSSNSVREDQIRRYGADVFESCGC